MSTESACPRAWQAEAVRDGVLSEADRASFERHVATCGECTAERAALARLEAVAQRMPSLVSTPLRRRAQHNELLRRANAQSLAEGGDKAPVRRVWFMLAACLVGLVLGGLVFSWKLPFQRAVEPSFALESSSPWTYLERGRAVRLGLATGTYLVSVNKLSSGQRFLLQLPDGELEVRGTRFSVELAARETRRVSVREGRVALRIQGRSEVLLGAGDSWPATKAQAALPSARQQDAIEPPPPATATGSSPSPSAAGRASPTRSKGRVVEAAPSLLPPTESNSRSRAATDFANAMAAFNQGDFGTAERLFREFELRYPGNSHAEDVLFLRALTHSRRGDHAGASALAKEYLERYPAGFRVAEAKRMLGK